MVTLIGVTPHKQTGIYWLRRKTPKHLVEQRGELEALGIAFKREILRTLGTRDPREAALVYPEKLREIEDVWFAWEQALASGPIKLSYKDTVALAGEYAKRFFDEHEAEPFDVPDEGPLPDPVLSDEQWQSWPRAELRAFAEAVEKLRACETDREGSKLAIRLVFENPQWGRLLAPDFAAYLRQLHGYDASAILQARGLKVDAESHNLLCLEVLRRMGRARAGLQQRREDDWSEVKGLHGLPVYEPSEAKKTEAPKPDHQGRISITFEEAIAEKQRLSDLRLAKHYRSSRTFDKYRQECALFVKWRGVPDIASITLREVVRWRDEMLVACDEGHLRRKTVMNRLADVRAVIGWAIEQNRMKREQGERIPILFSDGNPLANIDMPQKQTVNSEERTYTKEEARTLLKAARNQADQAKRWIPWIIVYSGARISEVAKLQKGDVMEHEGNWYVYIHDDDKPSTKNLPRRVPLHRAILAEGFLEFVEAAADGPLFPSKWTVKYVRNFVLSIQDLHGKPPLHGLRHLFGDMATGKLDLSARYYIEGRKLPGSGKDYGRSVAMVPELSRMMNSIEPLLPMNRRLSTITNA